MCSGRRRSNGRRIEMEKSPAAPKRCRIILCPEFAGAFLLSDRVLRDCTPRALPRASRSGRHVGLRPPRNDKSGSRCHFNGGPFESAALRRARLSAPLHWPVQFGSAFPRLHPKGTSSRFALRAPRRFAPRNDKSGVITVLTGACTSRQRCAGSGMPLPYNSGCGRRNCFKICNCQWRSLPVKGTPHP